MKTLIRRLRTLARISVGREPLVRRDLIATTIRLGSGYGGWEVVAAPSAKAPLGRDSIVYSVGVGEDVSFDLALIGRFGSTVHAFDPTPRSIDWVRGQELDTRFVLHEYGLADFDGNATFHAPSDPGHVSHTLLERPSGGRSIEVPMRTLRTIMRDLGHDRIDLLKMDIEGAEYGVIADLARSSIRPTQLLVEFHHRFPGVGPHRTAEAIRTLRSIGYRVFAISATNEEFGLLHAPQ